MNVIDLDLANTPDWAELGASCIGQWDLFSVPGRMTRKARAERVKAALDLCAACPALDLCRQVTFETRPHGVVQGGLDLTALHFRPGSTDFATAEAVAADRDVEIVWARITNILDATGVILTEYQKQFLDAAIRGLEPKWSYGSRRSKAARVTCEELLRLADQGPKTTPKSA